MRLHDVNEDKTLTGIFNTNSSEAAKEILADRFFELFFEESLGSVSFLYGKGCYGTIILNRIIHGLIIHSFLPSCHRTAGQFALS